MVDIQNLVAACIAPINRLGEVLKPQISSDSGIECFNCPGSSSI